MNPLTLFLSNTYTHRNALHRLEVLRDIATKGIFSSQKVDPSSLSPLDSAWIKSTGAQILKDLNKDNVYKVLDTIEDQIKNIKLLTVYLPVDLPEEEIDKIGERARKLYGSSLILDIKQNPELIAGPALVYQGVYKDYSIRGRIQENTEEILELLHSYQSSAFSHPDQIGIADRPPEAADTDN